MKTIYLVFVSFYNSADEFCEASVIAFESKEEANEFIKLHEEEADSGMYVVEVPFATNGIIANTLIDGIHYKSLKEIQKID